MAVPVSLLHSGLRILTNPTTPTVWGEDEEDLSWKEVAKYFIRFINHAA